MAASLDRRLVFGSGVLVAMLVVTSVLTFQNTRRLNDDAGWVAHTHEVMDALEEVIGHLREAEAVQRTYLIMGGDSPPPAVGENVALARQKVEKIKGLTADNPQRQDRIPDIERRVDELAAVWADTARVRAEQGFDAAKKIVDGGRANAASAELRRRLREMDDAERLLLAERDVRRQATYHSALLTGALSGVAAVAGVVAFMLLLRRHLAERTRAAYEVAEQGERLRTTLASIGDGVITTDTAGRVTNLNAVAESLTGWATADAVGVPLTAVFNIVNEDTRQPVENPAIRALREGVIVGLANHTVLIARDGAERPIDDSAAPIRCKDGEVVGCVLVFRDITERHRQEAELRERERQFVTLAESIPQLCWMANPDGHIFWYNRRWYDYTGTTFEQMQGWGWQSVHDPAELPGVLERWKGSIATGRPFDMTFPLKGGDGLFRPFLTRVEPVKDDHGRVIRWFGTNTDITEIKRGEEALRASEARLQAFVDHAPVAIAMFDRDMRYLAASRHWLADFGLGDDITGKSHYDVFPGPLPERWREAHRRGLAGEVVRADEDRFQPAEGAEHWLRWEVRPWHTDAGETGGILVFSEDITPRKRAEEQLRASEERFRLAADAVNGIIYEYDFASGQVERSRGLTEVTGHRPDEVPPTAAWWADQLHPDDRSRLAHVDPNLVPPGPTLTEYRVRHKDGRWLNVEDRAVLLRGEGGRPVRMIGCTVDVTDRKRVEDELVQSRRRFEKMVGTTPDVVYVFDLVERRNVYISPAIRRILGCTPDDIAALGPNLIPTLVHPDDLPAVADDYLRFGAMAEGEICDHTIRFRHANGEYRWLRCRETVFERDGDGRATKIIGTAQDVTDQKRQQEALAAGEERLRLAVEATGVGIFDFEPATGRQVFSDRAMQIWGFPPGTDPTPEVVLAAVHPEDRDWVRKAAQASLHPEGDRRFRVKHRITRPDGEVRWVATDGQTTFCRGGEGGRAVGTMLDVTDTERAMLELRESQRREQERAAVLETVLRAAPTPIWITHDRECRDITGNPASYRLVKTREDGVISATAPGDLPQTRTFREYRNGRPVAPHDLPMQTAAREGVEVHGTELTLKFTDGDVKTIYGNAVPLRDPGGRVTGAISAFVDITRLKEIEAALKDADRRKDEFLATLAHELRNPLAPIQNGVQIIKMSGPSGAVGRSLEMMERQLGHLVHLIDDLLDISRISIGKLHLRRERVALPAVVEAAVEAVMPLVAKNGHELTVMPVAAVWLDGDPTRLSQIISNLLTNAAKYTERGGRITLTAKRDGAEAVVSVRDTGIGIPPAMLGKVFEMFGQIDRTLEKTTGGLGIGLSLVKGLVEMHGGTVSAHSEGEGQGSEFTVRLPVVADGIGAGGQPMNDSTVKTTGRRVSILVVDDNEDAAESMATMLEMFGNDVRTAFDGEAGLREAEASRPQVVFLDIGMPKVNGFDAARRIRAEAWGKDMILVALTGWGSDDDRRKTEEAGFDRHLTKPLNPQALKTLLAELVPVGA